LVHAKDTKFAKDTKKALRARSAWPIPACAQPEGAVQRGPLGVLGDLGVLRVEKADSPRARPL